MPPQPGGSTARETVAAFMSLLVARGGDAARTGFAALPFALASAALLLFQLGYSFETGDQLQYLLLPYRELFPNFLPGDWFTWQTSHYHLSFAWLVRAVHALTGPSGFARGIFRLHCVGLAAFGYAIWRLSHALRLGLFEACFTVLVFACVRQIGLAGALIDHAGLLPADLALAPFLLACAAFCERRALAMGCWLGVAGLLHANYAVLGPLVLFPLELWRALRERRSAALITAGSAFALVCAPTLFLLVGTFLAHDSAPAAVAVTLFVRSPHHYDLASMRADEFYFAGALGLLSLPYWRARASSTPSRESLQLLAALLATLSLGLVGSGWHVLGLARLFAWRMSIPMFALLLLGAGATLRRLLRERDLPGLAWFLGAGGVLITFAQSDPLQASPWNQAPRLAACMLLALAGASVAQLWTPTRAWLRRAKLLLSVLGSALAAAIAVQVARTPQWDGHSGVRWPGLHFLDARIELEPPRRALFSLVRTQTPEAARFLIPPGQQLFRLHARRAVFVDWKCAPMKGDEALEWQRRMLLVMGTTSFPARGYELPRAADALYYARPLAELAALARQERLTHLLVRTQRSAPHVPGLRKLFGVGDYVVYELEF
jgi:hypothetical protein